MALTINHNLMAMNTARNLGTAYGGMSTSVQRLSSGLRVGTAADDAAGLAIRELMRADIKAINQGVRNANDAISMIQVADGALGVIDEKLIRMKELAMQASTGTYSSDQRLILDSEYQAMASEITRIARATDFNGMHLLNGNLESDSHVGSNISPTGEMLIHFGPGNASAEDYYNIQIDCCTSSALGVGKVSLSLHGSFEQAMNAGRAAVYKAVYDHRLGAGDTVAQAQATATNDANWQYNDTWRYYYLGYDSVNLTVGGYGYDAAILAGASEADAVKVGVDSVTEKLIAYISADYQTNAFALAYLNYDPYAERYLSGVGASISTQSLAQAALGAIDNAIVAKDKVRANLGAMQNRLENTITNLSIQAENLQASESRISDADVSQEMTELVREQILAQSATAMLAQANSFPKMALQLIQG